MAQLFLNGFVIASGAVTAVLTSAVLWRIITGSWPGRY